MLDTVKSAQQQKEKWSLYQPAKLAAFFPEIPTFENGPWRTPTSQKTLGGGAVALFR